MKLHCKVLCKLAYNWTWQHKCCQNKSLTKDAAHFILLFVLAGLACHIMDDHQFVCRSSNIFILLIIITHEQKSTSWHDCMCMLSHLRECVKQLIWIGLDLCLLHLYASLVSVEYLTWCLPLYYTLQMSAFSWCTIIFCFKIINVCSLWIYKMSTILVIGYLEIHTKMIIYTLNMFLAIIKLRHSLYHSKHC